MNEEIREYIDSVLIGDFSENQRTEIAHLVAEIFADQPHLNRNAYRAAALKFLRILVMIDAAMSGSGNPKREWAAIALGIGLPSAYYSDMTQSKLARVCRVSKMAISKQVSKFLDSVDLESAFTTGRYPGLKTYANDRQPKR